MTNVFLNYRVADEPYGAALLDRSLSERFGSEAVFLASKSIRLGADWEKSMFDAIRQSAALLVVMGKKWLDAVDDHGRRRLDDPDDFVRREILTAFELGKVVVPVRLNTPRLSRDELPPALAQLAACQDIEVRFRSAQPDIDNLANRLSAIIPELPAPLASTRGSVFTVNGTGTGSNVWQAERFDVGHFHAGPSYNGARGAS
ncbi:toll/interleukin-1 receptor domain-containing protein [Goodfellowiella coeruleoviolacea]|uniref:TIR domain-containing protein n=1 Tax=Goodfellowiella coeruleoviolacea TaxID=334858 RepID=A0AAE3KHF1_9PSEU|nr:toll/interleukin-1 receptor domain-containing protein [Goodfellowiella coeruleoviolacea]MCP2167240.1 TIR domain-containing protein [Goodfellowiella coeruleoviolacea]